MLPRLQEKRPDLQMIVMSARSNLLTAVQAQQRDVFEYLPKPFELRALLDVCARAIAAPDREMSSSGGCGPAASQPVRPADWQIAGHAGFFQAAGPFCHSGHSGSD